MIDFLYLVSNNLKGKTKKNDDLDFFFFFYIVGFENSKTEMKSYEIEKTQIMTESRNKQRNKTSNNRKPIIEINDD